MTRVALIDGYRTPFRKAGTDFSSHSFIDLGVHVVRGLKEKLALQENEVDELVFSTVLLDPRTPNWAREIVFQAGLSKKLTAHSVSNNCISGLVAVNMIREGILSGRIRSGIAGGSESMSRPTLTLNQKAEKFFLSLATARTFQQRMKILSSFRPGFILPQTPSPKEPSTGLTMGQHCELTVQELGISREWQDQIAFQSHLNAARAEEAGYLSEEILSLGAISKDGLIRKDTTFEKLAKLSPVFDRSGKGTLTAGNSSALTDGASALYCMSEEEAKKQGRPILAFIEAIEFAAIDPKDGLLMAPVIALPRLLERQKIALSDIDLFEIHEAFGGQVAANLKVWKEGWKKLPEVHSIGDIPQEKINRNGGSIALGHPFAATGGRILLSLARALRREKKKTGVISICAAGGMAGAVLLRTE